MHQYFALLSVVFMISFVALFDYTHLKGINRRFCKNGLMSQEEIQQLVSILSACQE